MKKHILLIVIALFNISRVIGQYDFYGCGRDGSVTINNTVYTDNSRAKVTSISTHGYYGFDVGLSNLSPTFNISSLNTPNYPRVILVQMKDTAVGDYGIYELTSYVGAPNNPTSVTLSDSNTWHDFDTVAFNIKATKFNVSNDIQMIIIPQWDSVLLSHNGIITCHPYDTSLGTGGGTGGILMFFVKNYLRISGTGKIITNGKGYFQFTKGGTHGIGTHGTLNPILNTPSPGNGDNGSIVCSDSSSPYRFGWTPVGATHGGNGGCGTSCGISDTGKMGEIGTNYRQSIPLNKFVPGNSGQGGKGGDSGEPGGNGGSGGQGIVNHNPNDALPGDTGRYGADGGDGGNGGNGGGSVYIRAFTIDIPNLSNNYYMETNGLSGTSGLNGLDADTINKLGLGGRGGHGGNGGKFGVTDYGSGGGGLAGENGYNAWGGNGGDGGDAGSIWVEYYNYSDFGGFTVFNDTLAKLDGGNGGSGGLEGRRISSSNAVYNGAHGQTPGYSYTFDTVNLNHWINCKCDENFCILSGLNRVMNYSKGLYFYSTIFLNYCTYDTVSLKDTAILTCVLLDTINSTSNDPFIRTNFVYNCLLTNDSFSECDSLFKMFKNWAFKSMFGWRNCNSSPIVVFSDSANSPLLDYYKNSGGYSQTFINLNPPNTYKCSETCRQGDSIPTSYFPTNFYGNRNGLNGRDGKKNNIYHGRRERSGQKLKIAFPGDSVKYYVENKEFIVMPNPATSDLFIYFTSSDQYIYDFSVNDTKGRMLLEKKYTSLKGNNTYRLNISNLDEGIYLLKIITQNHLFITKFVKLNK